MPTHHTDISSCENVAQFALWQIAYVFKLALLVTSQGCGSLRSPELTSFVMNRKANPKTEIARFRLAPDEMQFLRKQASDCGLTLSNFCRAVCLGYQPRQRLTADEVEMLREVRRLRNDLTHINNYNSKNPSWAGIRKNNEYLILRLNEILKGGNHE